MRSRQRQSEFRARNTQFISDTVIFLLTHVKYLIIINNQSLNYGA